MSTIFFRMSPIEQLLAVLHAYAAATGLAEATVSRRFLGGGGRAAQLRAGSDMGARTLVGALERFSDEWPEGTDWPVGVERPGCAGGEAFLPPDRPR
ncbi:MAG TPA: hypothetical protein VEF36_15330, partial [Roseiarcus sp.]|nr:hypothetical protein [Roseiarcus sp.]